MEIEKPFKCCVCNAQFTNEDHLSVHKKRHEMSLNLSKSSSSCIQQQHQSSLENFVDETPTPTRFFRNCEEVGLFQDLQNVNPFDEQFSKATPGVVTPSTGGIGQPFDFSMALVTSSTLQTNSGNGNISPSTISSTIETGDGKGGAIKRRYSDQETLNTPQVFGFHLSTTTSLTATTTTMTTTTNANNIQTVRVGKKFDEIKCSKLKTTLKLNLSPTSTTKMNNDKRHPQFNSSSIMKSRDPDPNDTSEKKSQLQERNRAASLRARERRKQWINNLESKYIALEKLLVEAKDEILTHKLENKLLRQELLKHSDCDVTKRSAFAYDANEKQGSTTTGRTIEILVQNQSQDLISIRSIPSDNVLADSLSSIQESISIIKSKTKRGRPRKGEERRTQIISIPSSTIHTPLNIMDMPMKIQLFPVNSKKYSS